MGAIIYLAEAATVLWFLVFFVIIEQQYRAGPKTAREGNDPVGRTLVVNARIAQTFGLGLFMLYLAAASLNAAFDLGLELPL